MNRFALVRELVKDPSLRITDIAKQTGYNKGHVSRLRKESDGAMTKLEAWKAWCESAGTPDLATEFTLEQSSHGKAFSFAWERGFVDGMQYQMKSSVEKTLEKEQESIRLQCTTCGTVYADGLPPQVAQPEEEPVAWRSTSPDGKLSNEFAGTSKEVNWTPIYTEPPKKEWVGLTDDEIEHIADSEWEEAFVRMIEAKLREKNQ